MRNEENLRLKDWYKAMKKSNIVNTQTQLGSSIKNMDGAPMSQAFISSMINGDSAVSEHTIESITKIYYFTSPDYFKTGEKAMVNLHELMQWILKTNNKTQKWLVKVLKDDDITEPILSLMDNRSPIEKWNKIFDRLNKLGYTVNPVYLISQHAGEEKEFTGKSDQVRRLFEAIDFLTYQRKISSKREFCDIINAVADGRGMIYEQTLSNMASTRYKQDVTKDMAVNFLKAFKEFSSDWFLLGNGPMLRDASTSYTMLLTLQENIKNLTKTIESKN